ncbi:MAG: nucleotidyltransferase family protein, partial [Lachnospiraceae bacterium]|nr:nucleotidyltransferase family protein [Lachnospiraceae bacterium]
AARATALDFHFGDRIENLPEILESPNNILGIEYLRALQKLNSPITPMTVHRWKTRHNALDAEFPDVASATALREMLYEEDGGVEKIVPYVTPYTAREFALKHGVCTPVRADDFSLILQYKLMNETDRLTEYLDFAPELADRVKNLLPDCYTFKEWSAALKTKAFTHTRINRALIHTILGIRTTDLEEYVDEDFCMYARILGFRASASPLFSQIRANTNLPIISKMADARNILTPKAMRLLMIDVRTSDIFRSVVYNKFGTLLKDDYTAGIVKY